MRMVVMWYFYRHDLYIERCWLIFCAECGNNGISAYVITYG
ncbi:hypothetical protein E2C01_054475 [Portunus trituberculatus]|uniref:Uncharacterized protein n=1 Tax=Portunus trituberculatus TaxID=210409 RepID=A0A5B7GJY1_PORTR|nr:hypothetical protein [Portunus trituberculatus]